MINDFTRPRSKTHGKGMKGVPGRLLRRLLLSMVQDRSGGGLGSSSVGDGSADGGGDELVDIWEVSQQVSLIDWMWTIKGSRKIKNFSRDFALINWMDYGDIYRHEINRWGKCFGG